MSLFSNITNNSKSSASAEATHESNTNSWIGRTCSAIKPHLTFDNFLKVSALATAVLGGSLLLGSRFSSVDASSTPIQIKIGAEPDCSCLFDVTTNPGVGLNYVPLESGYNPINDLEERLSERFETVQKSARSLKREVFATLKNGGTLESMAEGAEKGTGGTYLIKDSKGKTIAIFKPENEGIWRPENPNPKRRKRVLSADDIYFHQVNSWEQGNRAKREQLVELLFEGKMVKFPRGAIVEITSDKFFDLEAEKNGHAARIQTKRGFLQEWIPNAKPLIMYHPTSNGLPKGVLPPMDALNFHDNPMLDRISLDQYQEIALYDMLVYNEDRNTRNVLVTFDSENNPNLVPIDHDAVLPWKLKNLYGLYSHKKAKEPFTANTLKLIDSWDPDYIEVLVEKMQLSEQASINAKALALVIKRFAAAGATLHDISRFISSEAEGSSKLWESIEQANTAAMRKLPKADKQQREHARFLRRADWCETLDEPWCAKLTQEEKPAAALWQKKYKENEKNIDKQFKELFWDEIKHRIDEEAKQFEQKENCQTLGSSNLCWSLNQLTSDVSHYKFAGEYEGKPQRFELLKIKKNGKAKLKVQDARGVFKKREKSSFGRLHLTDLASRVPNVIAAISGGNFHYNPPPGEYYLWDGAEYKEGDPIGEVVVDGKVISQNPDQKNWGSFRIDTSGQSSIVSTESPTLEKNIPQYSLGAVPILIKKGRPVTTPELGSALSLKAKQAPTPGIQFQSHINMHHARAAVCKTEQDDHLLAIIEGRQKDAEGLRMAQFARFLKSLGCKDALNLDGGGTADLVTKDKDGKFKSTVTSSDLKGKRPVATSIVITEELI